ncbi:MAG: cation:proton antiporter [Clostridia bacterium]|nr:cation:proton antiporter [Clostridia bacterium]
MLFSIALIMLLGFLISGIFGKMKIPGLLGMILTGIILGPHALDLISKDILGISAELREIALVIILVRAGLSIDLKDLVKVGRPAFLLCFIPATLEIGLTTLLGPMLFGITYLEAAMMGSVIAAVSPAIVVPAMLRLMEAGYGKNNSIPQMIMAGATIGNIYVIILFTIFLGMWGHPGSSGAALLQIPVSILTGFAAGVLCGLALILVFRKFHIRDTIKVLVILSVSFLLILLEDFARPVVLVSGLLGIMALGGTIRNNYEVLAKRLVGKFSKIWVGAEMLLFVLVGAAVDMGHVADAGVMAVLLICATSIARTTGVFASLIKTQLGAGEKAFCAVSYLPGATVQAAIGAVPLAMGVPAGELILAVAVISILMTAPAGAIGIDRLHKRLLSNN